MEVLNELHKHHFINIPNVFFLLKISPFSILSYFLNLYISQDMAENPKFRIDFHLILARTNLKDYLFWKT
jgi:hypothetical protein